MAQKRREDIFVIAGSRKVLRILSASSLLADDTFLVSRRDAPKDERRVLSIDGVGKREGAR